MDMNTLLLMGPMNTQAFWIWLVLGILLLGIEVFLGTQWLLWAAASAGTDTAGPRARRPAPARRGVRSRTR